MKEIKLGPTVSATRTIETVKDDVVNEESFHLLRYGQLPDGLLDPLNRGSAKLSKSEDGGVSVSFEKVCLVLRIMTHY